MKRATIVFSVFFLAVATIPAFSGPPTKEDVESDILPDLVLDEITMRRKAGLDSEKFEIVDFASIDLGPWGEPGCYQITFRTFWTATEDVYADCSLGRQLPEGEVWLVRCGRAGRSYSEKWKDLYVEQKSEKDENGEYKTSFVVTGGETNGMVEWDFDIWLSSAAVKSFWESKAAYTGQKLVFYEDLSDLPDL